MSRLKKIAERLEKLGDKTEIMNKYIKLMEKQLENGDTEGAHYEADELLCKLLKELGMSKVVEVYEKVDKWYS